MVIADSGSTDATHQILLRLRKKYPKLEILSDTEKEHGPKLIALYKYAIEKRADYIFQTDSDGQTVAGEFEDFWEMRTQYDAVIGNRQIRGDGKLRKFVEKVLCWILYIYFGVSVPDANAPFRLMRAEVVEKYLNRLPFKYNLPNVMLTAYFAYYREDIIFKNITFRPRQGGMNSVNIPKIVKIGWKALYDFGVLGRDMKKPEAPERKRNIKYICSAERQREILIILFLAFLTFIFLQASPLSIWREAVSRTDSSVYKTIALEMSKGRIPYKDTFDHKGPLIYIVNWIGLSLSYYKGIWAVELLMDFSAFYIMYRIARLCCGKLLALGCTLTGLSLLFSYFQGGNLTEEYAMLFIAGGLYIFLDYFLNGRITQIRLIACGFCFGAICLLRPNMIAVWCVFCIAVLIQCIIKKEWERLWKFIGFFTAGFAIIVIPVLIWLGLNDALVPFWQDYIVFNMAYTTAEQASLLAKTRVFFEFATEPVVFIAILGSMWLCYGKKWALGISYFLYLLCSLILLCLSGKSFGHYGMVLVPAVIFPIAQLASVCEKEEKIYRRRAGIVMLICLFLIFIMPDWTKQLSKVRVYYITRYDNQIPDTLHDVCNYITFNTLEEENISVYGNSNIIYVLSRRLPAAHYSYQFPLANIDPSILDEYFSLLEQELPKLIILYEKEGKMQYQSDRMKAFLCENKYLLADRFGLVEEGQWIIYCR